MPTKVHLVKPMVFPVVMYGCESWTIKKAKCWRTDVFELWCWRRPLSVPWTTRRSNQSILKEINPEYSLEGLMLKLKLQYFGHLMWRADPLEKTLMLGKIEGRRRRGQQKMRWLYGITDSWTWVWASSKDGEGQGSLECCSPWGCEDWTQLSNWTKKIQKDVIMGIWSISTSRAGVSLTGIRAADVNLHDVNSRERKRLSPTEKEHFLFRRQNKHQFFKFIL